MNWGIRTFLPFLTLILFGGTSIRAENIVVGTLIDDSGELFSSFGNQYTRGTTRGANFGGTSAATWYGVNMSSTSGQDGITWGGGNGAVAWANQYFYTGTYTGTPPGTAAAAQQLTNTGIWGPGTTITISATAGMTYVIDLLFANAFSGGGINYAPYRTMDVKVGGSLYADDLTLNGTASADRRPLVYRFEVTPTTNSIDILFESGGDVGASNTDKNPYVNAMMVSVPEPSALSLLVVGLGGVAALRRLRRKAD